METTLSVAQGSAETEELVSSFHASMERIREQVHRIIVGQDDVVDNLLVTLLVGGHCLITGMPGTAKTLLVSTLAAALGLTFKRIQFTPDLMPTDITGTDILEEDSATGRRSWTFVQGPLFTNVLLADEVNRTPPKTQAALLEAMQEHSVTVRGNSYELRPPFFVLATQNPIELEGTYPLPEAQLDRFMFNVVIRYLSEDDEVSVVTATTGDDEPCLSRVLDGDDILAVQHLVRRVPVAEEVARYAVRLVDASRPGQPNAPPFVEKWVRWGASLRASQALVLGGKARALVRGRYHVSVDDVRALAHPILRHRIITNFYAESDGVDADDVVDRLLETVPAPASGM